MNALDRWWNRRFPPYSGARLAFLLAATPFISGAVVMQRGALTGSSGSWTNWLGLTLASQAVVTLGWVLARNQLTMVDLEDEDHVPADGRDMGTSGLPSRRPWPMRRSRVLSDRPRPKPRSLSVAELLGSWAMLFVAVAFLVTRISPDGGLSGMQLLLDAGAATVAILLIITSFSLTVIIIVAALISYPFAELLRLFFYFLSGDESVWGYWVFTFAFAMSIGLPMWMQVKALKRQRRWPDLPLWATAGGTAFMVMLSALTLGGSLGEGAAARPAEQTAADAERARQAAQTSAGSATPVGAPFPDLAVKQFLAAWSQRYPAGAARVAVPEVVALVNERDFPPGLVFERCENPGGSQNACTAGSPEERLVFMVLEVTPSHHVVASVRNDEGSP